jgi:SAM-dependent methyltransferase
VLWNNPLHEQTFEQFAAALALSPGERVLDVGCGSGEMLIRLVEKFGVRGVGIDHSEKAIQESRERAAQRVRTADLEWIVADAAAWRAEHESFDAALCVGSTHAFGLGSGAFQRAIRALIPPLRRGGRLLIGEGFMKRPADREYRAVLGDYPPDDLTHSANIAAARSCGLVPLSAWVASDEEWDEFEWAHHRQAEQAAEANPDDTQIRARLARSRRWMDAYQRWGRDTLGFGIYLLGKPDESASQ